MYISLIKKARQIFSVIIVTVFSISTVLPPRVHAQTLIVGTSLSLPPAGSMITTSLGFSPVLMKGIQIFPEDPLKFDFIVDSGETGLENDALKDETSKIIKYFLAGLTVPKEDLWVNLSPYEEDYVIPEAFGNTEMGRDLLAQDYILKQLSASLIYPEDELGQNFWDLVYARAYEQYGTTNLPINTFNKIWIVPEKAVVYENGDMAFVIESRLKVMLEEDYLSIENNLNNKELGTDRLKADKIEKLSSVSSEIVREIVLPAIEKEVNEGENFAVLRQIYNSLILATWFKNNLKESLLGKVYVDQKKIAGVDVNDPEIKEKIYQQYLKAFEKGAYNYIRNDYDPYTQKMIKRKYISGGAVFDNIEKKTVEVQKVSSAIQQKIQASSNLSRVGTNLRLQQASSPIRINKTKWSQFTQQEGLTQYPELLKSFTPEIQEVLLGDPTLQPVFLQVLPEDQVGDLKIFDHNQDFSRSKIGNKTLKEYMQEYTGFLVGTPEIANKVAKQGQKIIVGVVDRKDNRTLESIWNVANGSQSYFPLPDGTWLGVKGSGYFASRDGSSFKITNKRNNGILNKFTELNRSMLNIIKKLGGNAGGIVNILGSREINVLPDGSGSFIKKESLGAFIQPVLVFNHVISPHRLSKLPQIIATPGSLAFIAKRLSKALKLPKNKKMSPVDLIRRTIKGVGKGEAQKQNKGLYHETVHAQDIVMGGRIADVEELRVNQETEPLLKMNINDMRERLKTIRKLASDKRIEDQFNISSVNFLKEFFDGYFQNLNGEYLILWADITPETLNSIYTPILKQFISGVNPFNQNFENSIKTISSWAQEQVNKRTDIVISNEINDRQTLINISDALTKKKINSPKDISRILLASPEGKKLNKLGLTSIKISYSDANIIRNDLPPKTGMAAIRNLVKDFNTLGDYFVISYHAKKSSSSINLKKALQEEPTLGFQMGAELLITEMRTKNQSNNDIKIELNEYLKNYSYQPTHSAKKVAITSPTVVAFFKKYQLDLESGGDKTEQSNILNTALTQLDFMSSLSITKNSIKSEIKRAINAPFDNIKQEKLFELLTDFYDLKGATIADIASGMNFEPAYGMKKGGAAQIYRVDNRYTHIEMVDEGISLLNGDARQLDQTFEKKSLDAIVFNQSIDQILLGSEGKSKEVLDLILSQAQIVLKDGGRIIFNTYNNDVVQIVNALKTLNFNEFEIFKGSQGSALISAKKFISSSSAVHTFRKPFVQQKGGIDLTADRMDVQTRGEGSGFDVPLDIQALEEMNFDGLVPEILMITPIPAAQIPLLLGKMSSEGDLPLQDAHAFSYAQTFSVAFRQKFKSSL